MDVISSLVRDDGPAAELGDTLREALGTIQCTVRTLARCVAKTLVVPLALGGESEIRVLSPDLARKAGR
jgi:hypothetical protein